MRELGGLILALFSSTICAAQPSIPRTIDVPEYPGIALAARISGTVIVIVDIGTDGKVVAAEAQTGHPLLRREAEKCLRTWVFRVPSGQDNPVKEEIKFDYRLADELPTGAPTWPVVTLRSPTSVEISAPPMIVQPHSRKKN